MAIENAITKICKICNESKSLEEFHKTPTNKDGRAGSCKVCAQEKQHARYNENREVIRKKANEKLKSDPEKLKQKLESLKKWREENPEKHKEGERIRNQKYRARHSPEELAQKNKEWRDKNQDHIKEHRFESRYRIKANSANYKARKIRSIGFITEEQIEHLHLIQDYKCKMCFVNIENSFEVDHIIPFSKKGSNEISNIQLTCTDCNLKKATKTLHDLQREKTHKTCSICNVEKKINEFVKDIKRGYCKVCAALVSKTYRKNNPELAKAASLKARLKNREKNALRERERRKKSKAQNVK